MTMGRSVGNYPAALVLYFLCMGLWYPVLGNDGLTLTVSAKGDLGMNASITCVVEPVTSNDPVSIQWLFEGKPLNMTFIKETITYEKLSIKDNDGNLRQSKISTILLTNVTYENEGNYTCVAKEYSKNGSLDLRFEGAAVEPMESKEFKVNVTARDNITLTCTFKVYKPSTVYWFKKPDAQLRNDVNEPVSVDEKPKVLNLTYFQSTFVLLIRSHEDNGTYYCQMEDAGTMKNISGVDTNVKVYGNPHVSIDRLIPISSTQIYINWTVQTYNSPIKSYNLKYYAENEKDKGFKFYYGAKTDGDRIGVNSTSFVMKDCTKSTKYEIMLEVETTFGRSSSKKENVTTLAEDPVFVPNISINGFSATSVTIGWSPPPEDIAHLIHFYNLEARNKHDNKTYKAVHPRDGKNLPYMFEKLEPHSTYFFKVSACSEYTNSCGNWSQEMEAATLDGVPGEPSNVFIYCDIDFLNITWNQPIKPNAEIKGYTMEITGLAQFKDRDGRLKNATWGPMSKFMGNETFKAQVDDLPANTHFTVRLSAVTRTRRRGDEVHRNCSTKHTHPTAPPRPRWRKIREQDDTYKFKVYLPRVTERNGPICCYRVYVVRLPPQMDWKTLPPPQEIDVSDYNEVHANPNALGAYITDIFSNEKFPDDSEILLGDEKPKFDSKEPVFTSNPNCSRCLQRPKRNKDRGIPLATTSTTTVASVDDEDDEDDDFTTLDPVDEPKTRRRRRNLDADYSKMAMMADSTEDDRVKVSDGRLDPAANYSMFVEVISEADNESMFSDLTIALMPAPSPPVAVPSSMMEIALQITCAIAAVILLLMIIFCIMQTRRTRKMPPQAQIEMHNPITAVKRYWDSIRGHGAPLPPAPADMPPVPREALALAYAQRQQDSDYGFQKEFEWLQLLPDCYADRTTHASEARENQPKNRYPDIKAYDQTRVKLSQIDGISGSDYINANFVMGYQERKKFICAQGPTDTTVNDFWRMIWEHGLELIVMLTNLEEYSKVKCSKYWPDERFSKVFGNITVQHVGEKRYSDYIVRELKISKQPTNADGQPIVENNGIAKRNGDIKDGSESSAPTSPRDTKDSGETRIVRQYHFLMWKDFAAPEHPHSILKFIKRVNEAWSGMVGRAVAVHCSAGVGRTGTLVALDCLLDQLRATGHVSVYNTVAELRRQRNFLVQSLKQYVFVYRALVEYAHFGDTELAAGRLRPATDRLRNTPDTSDKCLMEIEFEKIVNSPIAETVKSSSAGAGEELRARNRSPECLPYDRNRVILTPLPARDYSTYINASFIQAYDNSEGFIITQDPLPNTILDFWRMVSEHNVTTIVMLSELGDGKCPRYWDDGTVQYEHMSVQYEESESCPYYTRRQFRVTNEKNGSVQCARQLQYQGWPTARGAVPEVTRGLAELADAAATQHHGTMLVHCQLGTERSPLFVALCTLIRQLRTERRVDVSAVARALRDQRARTIDTFTQYEFLYRAILNYAELHNLLEDS